MRIFYMNDNPKYRWVMLKVKKICSLRQKWA